uniref:POP4 domain-containing protein n=1 Tax=Mesocestoides corti TaxID=53468 RepID=A0A5K3FXY5_MESCO
MQNFIRLKQVVGRRTTNAKCRITVVDSQGWRVSGAAARLRRYRFHWLTDCWLAHRCFPLASVVSRLLSARTNAHANALTHTIAHLAGVTPLINGCDDVCNHGRVSRLCPRIVVAGDQARECNFFCLNAILLGPTASVTLLCAK